MKSREKIVTKITRDGAVEINKDSGEVKRVSNRESEVVLKKDIESVELSVKDNIRLTRKGKLNQLSRFKRSRKRYKINKKLPKSLPHPNRIQFTDEDRNNPKLKKHIDRSEQAVTKLETATATLPVKKKLKIERDFDENSGKGKTRLVFKEEVKRPNTKIHHSPLNRPINEVSVFTHGKIHEVEKENVGVESAHSTEKLTEKAVSDGITKFKHHRMNQKLKPYRDAAKLENKSDKANIKFRYEKAKSEHELSSNPISRMIQKRKIKREYYTAKIGKQTVAATVKKSVVKTVDTVKKAVSTAAHSKVILIIVGAALLLAMLMAGFTACSSIFTGVISGIFGSSYSATDDDIHDSDLRFTELGVELTEQINNIESDYPDYDEYIYNIPEPLDFTHDPFKLIAFLSAIYDEFTYDEVQAVIEDIFNQMYSLEIIETIEYDYKTLTVTLNTKSFDDVIMPILESADVVEIYELYMETSGNHQYFGSPFGFAWRSSVTCLYGYRVHPIDGVTELHRGIDIAAPYGTEIMAIHTGTVITATFHSSYGNYIIIETTNGYRSVYAHCSRLLVSVGDKVNKGDVIAEVGSTGASTGNHLHLEIRKDDKYLNPIFLIGDGNIS